MVLQIVSNYYLWDLEVRIFMDEPVENENVAIEFFELYMLGECYTFGCHFRVADLQLAVRVMFKFHRRLLNGPF